jgi:hypothetical protein
MKNNQKVVLVSVALIAIGIYYIYKQRKQEPIPVEENNDTNATKPDWSKVLKKGSQGVEVEFLQKALKGDLIPDGNFGVLTEDRLKKVMNVTETSINDYNKFINKK